MSYKAILATNRSVERLFVEAERLYGLRQPDKLATVANVLSCFYPDAGAYFSMLASWCSGKAVRAEHLLDSPIRWVRARASITEGAISWQRGDLDSALNFFDRSLKQSARDDLWNLLNALKMRAVIHSTGGESRLALTELENLYPLASRVSVSHPAAAADYINSLIVELTDANRISEARQLSQKLSRSPLLKIYPEVLSTINDPRLQPRNVIVTVPPKPDMPTKQESMILACLPVKYKPTRPERMLDIMTLIHRRFLPDRILDYILEIGRRVVPSDQPTESNLYVFPVFDLYQARLNKLLEIQRIIHDPRTPDAALDAMIEVSRLGFERTTMI